MYRLIPTFTLAFGIAAATLATAQQPELEFTFVEDMQPTKNANPAAAGAATKGLPTPAITLPEEASVVAAADSTASVLETKSTEEPKTPAVEATQSEPEAQPRRFVNVDFAQIFESLSEDINFLSKPVPDGQQVKPATAVVEQNLITQNVEILDQGVAYPEPVAVVESSAVPIEACNQCQSSSHCKCRSGRGCMTRVRNWWHNTKLYRLHVQNIGNPGMFVRPFGECNEGYSHAMITSGKVDRSVLHHYDFVHHADGRVSLTDHGREELVRIADVMSEYPVPLTIETTRDPNHDNARRTVVMNTIAQLGLPIATESIRIAPDRAIGLNGVDAQMINALRISEMATGSSRTRPFRDAGGATIIPIAVGGDDNQNR